MVFISAPGFTFSCQLLGFSQACGVYMEQCPHTRTALLTSDWSSQYRLLPDSCVAPHSISFSSLVQTRYVAPAAVFGVGQHTLPTLPLSTTALTVRSACAHRAAGWLTWTGPTGTGPQQWAVCQQMPCICLIMAALPLACLPIWFCSRPEGIASC